MPPKPKLTPEQLAAIAAAPAEVSNADLARQYGVDPSLISRTRTGKYAPAAAILAPIQAQETAPPGGGQIVFRPLDRLGRSPKNERTVYDEDTIEDIAASILGRGLLQNLVVYAHPTIEDFHLVAAGGRRWLALNLLADRGQLPDDLAAHGIPCKLVKDEAEALQATVIENLQRVDVHFLDRAAAYARLRDELSWSPIRIAETVGATNDHVTQYLRVHDRLPADLRAAARRGELNFKQAREAVAEKKETYEELVGAAMDTYQSMDDADLERAWLAKSTMVQAHREAVDVVYRERDRKRRNAAWARGCTDDQLRKAHAERRNYVGDFAEAIEFEVARRWPAGMPTPESTVLEGEPTAEEVEKYLDRAAAAQAPARRGPPKVPGEVGFPSDDYACIAWGSQFHRVQFIEVQHRTSGQRIRLVAEQRDLEDIAPTVATRVRNILVTVGRVGTLSGPIRDSESLAGDLDLNALDAENIGTALTAEFGLDRPPFIANADDDTGFAELGFDTVGDLVKFMEKRLAAGQQAAE